MEFDSRWRLAVLTFSCFNPKAIGGVMFSGRRKLRMWSPGLWHHVFVYIGTNIWKELALCFLGL